MHNLKDKLSAKINKSYIDELCQQSQDDNRIIKALYLLSTDNDEKTSWNALWALSNLKNSADKMEWLYRKQDELINRAIKETNSGKKRLILNLLSKQDFYKKELRTDFIDFCLKQMSSDAETAGCKALYIKLAYKQCRYYKELIQELKLHLELILQEAPSPAVKSAATNVCKKLNNDTIK